ncbi:hypothetical protein [Acidisoma silvae]|uniref:Uncharacterized protein n=1 Tax=Acidisoma silvae TaxID=2802396 RepID=A0A963YVK2_9PROT|nr:hypothetical protein [Acidisoma silvae]MCB8877220.1 hypothetical protein [Acidisoma silvae]
MTEYIFERNDEAKLTEGKASTIVHDADYAETKFTYEQYEVKKVKVLPKIDAPDMNVNTLEHAARTKTGTPITVTKLD